MPISGRGTKKRGPFMLLPGETEDTFPILEDGEIAVPKTPESCLSEEVLPATQESGGLSTTVAKTRSSEELPSLDPVIDFDNDGNFDDDLDSLYDLSSSSEEIMPDNHDDADNNEEDDITGYALAAKYSSENDQLRNLVVSYALKIDQIQRNANQAYTRASNLEEENQALERKLADLKARFDDINYRNVIDFGNSKRGEVAIRIKRIRGARKGALVSFKNRGKLDRKSSSFKKFSLKRDKIIVQ